MVGTLCLVWLTPGQMRFIHLLGKLPRRHEVRLLGMILAFLSSGPVGRAAFNVALTWNPSPDTNVVGYVFYNSVVGSNYTNNTDVGNRTSATLTNLDSEVPYVFYVTAYGSDRVQSDPSNIIVTNFPPSYPPPTIATIPDYQIGMNSSAGPIVLAIGDPLIAAESLYLSALSSNPTVVPNGNILFGGSDSNRTVTVVPALNEVGETTVTLFVSNGITNASTSFLLTVTPAIPPRFVQLPFEAESATLVSPMAVSPDPDASGGQFVATSSAGSGTATFDVDIPVTGPYAILCRVRLLEEDQYASFLVSADDAEPGRLFAFQGIWSDGWRWTLANISPGGFKVSDSNGSINNMTVIPLTAGQHRITFSELDPRMSLDEILVTNDRNSIRIRPVLTVPPDQSINELTSLVVTNSATDTNILANALTFSLVSAPRGVDIDSRTGVLTWTPSEAQGPSTNLITVQVTDDGATPLYDRESFTVVVKEVNRPPTVRSVPDQTIRPGSLLTVTNIGSDPDIPPNTLTFSLGPGSPAGAAMSASSGIFTWQPTAGQADSTNAVTIKVTDDGSPGLSDSTTFKVIVTPLSPITLGSMNLANGQFHLTLRADAGINYTLQASTNLKSWIPLTNVKAPGAEFELVDGDTALFPYRFYRVVVGP